MVNISGPLIDVADNPANVREIWVRARTLRLHGDGLMTPDPHRAEVENGQVTFPCAPGPAIMVLVYEEQQPVSLPIVVPEGTSATLREVAEAGMLADQLAQDWSIEWEGDQLRVLGELSPHLTGPRGLQGETGNPGRDGIDGEQGPRGPAPEIINGTWWIDGVDTGSEARGPRGYNGTTPHIGEDGIWRISGTNTGVSATGPQGERGEPGPAPQIIDGTWWIDGVSTFLPARGPQGVAGTDGQDGADGISPVLQAGTATTLPAGSAPTVEIMGTQEQPVINLGVPLPARTPRILVHTGTGDPVLANFPDAQVGDLIERLSDGQRWKVEAS